MSAEAICYDKYKGHLAIFDNETEWDAVATWLQSIPSIVQATYDEMAHVQTGYSDFEGKL